METVIPHKNQIILGVKRRILWSNESVGRYPHEQSKKRRMSSRVVKVDLKNAAEEKERKTMKKGDSFKVAILLPTHKQLRGGCEGAGTEEGLVI